MLMLPECPFIFPPAEPAEIKSLAIFGPSGEEEAARKHGRVEWQLQPIPHLRSQPCSF